ncbi:MAG: hypothetical protein IH840_05075 [Candidatus Heimdallarchaeota archaeon]|nr:hypothetical protein [Candidatus Heimdallarchaeota archaeon]
MGNKRKPKIEKSPLAYSMDRANEPHKVVRYDELTLVSHGSVHNTKPQVHVQDKDFAPKFYDFEKGEKFRQLITPDKTELYLILGAVIATYFLARWMRLDFVHPATIIFVGIISFTFFCTRWGYMGVGHFNARVRQLREEVVKSGRPKIDFKIFGFVASFLFIIGGTVLLYLFY